MALLSDRAPQTDKGKLSCLLYSQKPRQLAFAAELGRWLTRMAEVLRQVVLSFVLFAIVASLRGEEQPAEIEAILIHPPYAQTYSCSEHWDGQFQYLGDALGVDCTIVNLVEEDGRIWMSRLARRCRRSVGTLIT